MHAIVCGNSSPTWRRKAGHSSSTGFLWLKLHLLVASHLWHVIGKGVTRGWVIMAKTLLQKLSSREGENVEVGITNLSSSFMLHYHFMFQELDTWFPCPFWPWLIRFVKLYDGQIGYLGAPPRRYGYLFLTFLLRWDSQKFHVFSVPLKYRPVWV